MAAVIPLPARAAESKGLLYWMERVLKERERVIASADEEAIHDLRVALRRCRSLASVFEEVDPNPAWRELRKSSRKLFLSLGVIRDSQVQELWVLKLAAADDPLRAQILYAVKNGRERQERDARKSAARFDEKYWVKLARELRPRLRLLPLDGDAAQCLALERYEDAAELHRRALRTEKPKPWHELRIGVKHLRYSVENLLPKLHNAWGPDLKRVQDLLGDIHDLDVLAETVRGAASDLAGSAKWQSLIARERSDRLETYRQIALGTTGLWSQWRSGLPTNGRVAVVASARLKATARAADPKFAKTAAVARLAHKLFRELRHAKVAALLQDEKLEALLNAAAMIHAIEPNESAKVAHKDARKFLAGLPPPPGWTAADWQLLSLIVRYHRGQAPSAENARFAELEPTQQAKLLLAAGILRIARALRKMGAAPCAILRAERKTDHLELLVAGFSEAQTAPKGLAIGRQMLEAAIGTAMMIRSMELAVPALPLQFPAVKPQPVVENEIKLLTGD
ncbi:MAG TPA: CHAD domain-containing protein [Candidatus Acidoferrum sp.]|nr:CHAD domain-containing protein [Candidatus Acidoferrum sp.]